jgi:hypothetical protein
VLRYVLYRTLGNLLRPVLYAPSERLPPVIDDGMDDRIEELCAKAVATAPSPELDEILQELRKALHEHSERLRKMVARYSMRREERA